MKKKIIALFLVFTLLLSLTITVSAEETTVSVNEVTANVGDTITLSVSVSGDAAIQTGSIALSFDSSALELVGGSWVLPNNPMLANFDTTKEQGVGAFSYMTTSSVLNGVVFEAQFKVLESAADKNSVDFTVLLKDANKAVVVNNVVVTGYVNTATEVATPLYVTDVSAVVGDIVTLAVNVENLADIQTGSIALAFDENALELVSGKWVLPNNPMLANFDTSKEQGVGAFSYMMTSSTLNGVVFEVQFKVLESASENNCVNFTVLFKDANKATVVDNAVVYGCVNVAVEDLSPLSVADVSASVGEVVTLALNVEDFTDIQTGSIALAFDENALELVSGKWVLPNNPMLANFDASKEQGVGAFSYMTTSSALSGTIFEVQLKVLEGAAEINSVEFAVTLKNSAKENVVDGALAVGNVKVEVSQFAGVCISDKITVFEMEALLTDANGVQPVLTVNKGDASYSFLAINYETKELIVRAGDCDRILCDDEANKILLDDVTPTDIALVYNDAIGTVRCYVNGNLAYYYTDDETRVPINDLAIEDLEFIAASGDEQVMLGQGVTLQSAYNICDSGTAEFVGFQVNNDDSTEIRLLAGLDMLYYGSVGFRVELYSTGILQGVVESGTSTVFTGVTANGSVITAESEGYRYLTAVSIVGIDRTMYPSDADVYFLVKTYTTVGVEKTYGATKKITISYDAASRTHIYSVDESYTAE